MAATSNQSTAEFERAQSAAEFLQTHFLKDHSIDCALVLGSGLGAVVENFQILDKIPFSKIPQYPTASVAGHKGELVLATPKKNANKKLLFSLGRFHVYEGKPLKDVTLPIRVFKTLGAKKLLLTNAAGGINLRFRAGDLMLIRDHINLMGTNPLVGPNEAQWGPRFPDLTHVYSDAFAQAIRGAAKLSQVALQEGIYMGTFGPCYETPAEIKMFRVLGADAVGMSTVPEAIVARHMNLETAAISCITNLGAGLSATALTHDEVLEHSATGAKKLATLLSEWAEGLE